MSIALTFSGMLGRRPTVSDLFRRPERENPTDRLGEFCRRRPGSLALEQEITIFG
jgi:hypothetical protein